MTGQQVSGRIQLWDSRCFLQRVEETKTGVKRQNCSFPLLHTLLKGPTPPNTRCANFASRVNTEPRGRGPSGSGASDPGGAEVRNKRAPQPVNN